MSRSDISWSQTWFLCFRLLSNSCCEKTHENGMSSFQLNSVLHFLRSDVDNSVRATLHYFCTSIYNCSVRLNMPGENIKLPVLSGKKCLQDETKQFTSNMKHNVSWTPLHEWATGSLPPTGRPPTRQVGSSRVHVSVSPHGDQWLAKSI